MFFNLWFHTKALFTMVALVWFLASVYYSMYYKIRFLDKVLVTMAALVWLLTSVFNLMLYKIRSPSKNISQWMHWNGFSPVCILTWFASSQLCTKLFSQLLQWYGFSPVGLLSCCIRLVVKAKLFSQCLHLNVFSPVCTLWWFSRWHVLIKHFHNLYLDTASHQCTWLHELQNDI